MKLKTKLLVFLFALALPMAGSSSTFAASETAPQKNEPIRWEYKVLTVATKGGIELNQAGADGWELVTVVRPNEGSFSVFYFKRPIQK